MNAWLLECLNELTSVDAWMRECRDRVDAAVVVCACRDRAWMRGCRVPGHACVTTTPAATS